MRDFFRPTNQPARTIYDAFQVEAKKRSDVGFDEWVVNERYAVWKAARDKAVEMGLRIPTMKDIESAEQMAMGHCDYGAKWAYGVSDAMHRDT